MAKAASEIKKALLAGERLTSDDAVKRFKGAKRNTLANTANALQKQGVKIHKERYEGLKVAYQLDEAPASPSDTTPIEPKTLPALGEMVEICALAIDRKGVIGITLRNAKHAWRVQVTDVVVK